MAEEKSDKKGLDNVTIALMICTALFYDALQALLTLIFMGWLVSIFAYLTFYTWFKIRGMNFVSAKRAGILNGGFIIELIPIINTLPAWTLAITLLALDSKIKKVIGQIPGGQMAGGVLANKMGVARGNSGIREPASEKDQAGSPKRSGTQPLYSINGGKGKVQQHIDERGKNKLAYLEEDSNLNKAA